MLDITKRNTDVMFSNICNKVHMKQKIYKIYNNILPICRGFLLHLRVSSIGKSARVGSNCEIKIHPGANVKIGRGFLLGRNSTIAIVPNANFIVGDNVGIGNGSYIVCRAKLFIGSGSMTGPNVIMYDHNHRYDLETGVDRYNYSEGEISIGKNCWIGAGAIILKDVHIGDNCVIGAGSVVTKDIPSGCVAVGSPAKIIRKNNSKKSVYE